MAEDSPVRASLLALRGDDPPRLKAAKLTRAQREKRIERDIAYLDHLDGDPDLEPDVDDERSLGWSAAGAAAETWPQAHPVDVED